MRIVAGRFKGRSIKAPQDNIARPTMERTRESLFNILLQGDPTNGLIEGRTGQKIIPLVGGAVLDAFAGTGALGLEAVSRGATEAYFMENNRQSLQALESNVRSLRPAVMAEILPFDCLHPPRAPKAMSVIFMDPPYQKGLIPLAIKTLEEQGWVDKTTLIVTERMAKEPLELPEGLLCCSERQYGKNKIAFVMLKEVTSE